MPEATPCPTCGSLLPAGADLGACPRCLLAAGLPDALSAEEVAASFPQLEILEFVGRGGMGVVYKARQVGLDRIVALKILPAALAEDPAFSDRFAREARTMARLDHPNIVRVHDFGQENERFFLLMEYVDGSNLRQVIDAGGLAPREALAIVPQVCEALQYAHDRGVVHRDIKPENVLLDREGRVKITDFGLAKLLHRDAGEHTLTRAGQVMGTPGYMAPEQYKTPDDVDHRADIYSLGVVFYEMLTGDVPMGNFEPPSHTVDVDVRLDDVVLRTLARERERRYQRVEEVRTEVASIASGVAPKVAAPLRQQTEPTPLSRLALYGFLLTPAVFLLPPAAVALARLMGLRDHSLAIGAGLAGLMLLLSFLLSLFGWIVIGRSRGRRRGLALAILGTILPVILAIVLLGFGVLLVGGAEEPLHGPDVMGPPDPEMHPVPVPASAPPTPSLPFPPTGDGKGIQELWNDLGRVLGQEKVTPSDLAPFVGVTDRRRLEALSPAVVARLAARDLLGLVQPSWPGGVMPYAGLPLTKLERDVSAPLARVTAGSGENALEFQVIHDPDGWHFALAPAWRGVARPGGPEDEIWTLVTGGGARETDPMIRRSILTNVEILFEIMKRYWEPGGIEHGARVPRDMVIHLVPPERLGRMDDNTMQALTTQGRRGRLGLAFLDADTLPRPLADYELLKVDLASTGRTATAITQAGDEHLSFPLVFDRGRWYLDTDLIGIGR